KFGDFAFRIEKESGLLCFPRSHDFLRLLGRDVALAAGRIRINRQPNDAFTGVLLLELLHVVAAVMFFHKRTFRIEPFEDDVFAFVLGQRLRLAVGVWDGKVGRSTADWWNIRG